VDGGDPPGAERAVVPGRLHLVDGLLLRVARAKEVAVQGVHLETRLHRAHRGDEGLPGDLAPERALQLSLGRRATEDVTLDALDLQRFLDGRHAPETNPSGFARPAPRRRTARASGHGLFAGLQRRTGVTSRVRRAGAAAGSPRR